jgi:hypothetical protein
MKCGLGLRSVCLCVTHDFCLAGNKRRKVQSTLKIVLLVSPTEQRVVACTPPPERDKHTTDVSAFEICLFVVDLSRLRRPCGLSLRSAAARLPGTRIRIPLRAWMFFCCVCCVLCR